MILPQWHKPRPPALSLLISLLWTTTTCGAAISQGSGPNILQNAVYLHSHQRFTEELSLLDAAIKKGEHSWTLCQQRALTYLKMDEMDKALSDLDEAIELAPKQAELLSLHGTMDSNMIEDERAVSYFTRAMKADPKYTDCLLPRATAYQQLTRYDLAVKDAKAYLQGSPARHTVDV